MLKREKDERECVKKEERESGLGRDHPLAASIACAKCYSFFKIKNKYVHVLTICFIKLSMTANAYTASEIDPETSVSTQYSEFYLLLSANYITFSLTRLNPYLTLCSRRITNNSRESSQFNL